jgi:hypothetical protein
MQNVAVALVLASQLFVPAVFAQTRPAVELEGAIAKEQVDGDLKTAIAIYQEIAADTSAPRDVRAKALLHLVRCYEKLGQQAQTVYRQIVRDFGDQPEASQALARLAALKEADHPTAPAGITQRKIQMPGPQMMPGDTDGRRAVYLKETTGEVIYGDLAGKSKRVIFRKKPGDYSGGFWSSRDFSIVAIKFHLPDKKEIFSVVKTDGTGYREVAKLDGEHFFCNWSWDNRYLLLSGHSQDGSFGLLRITVADGQIRELLNVKTGIAWGAKFSPEGRFVAYQSSPTFAFDGVARLFVIPAEGGAAIGLQGAARLGGFQNLRIR